MQYSKIKIRTILTLSLALFSANIYGQSETSELSGNEEVVSKSELRQIKRDSVRANKKIWTSIFGGPSYTPEASLGAAAAVLMSFKTNEKDTISQRSFLPVGVNVTINGTVVVAGSGTLFFKENKFRIYSKYGFRNEPLDYYGVGMGAGDIERGASTTRFERASVYFNNRFVWEVKDDLYVGPMMDINFSNNKYLSEGVANDPYINKYNDKLRYTNIGVGALIQYDTRDDVATPNSGKLLSATGTIFSRYLGSTYSYQLLDLEYRQFKHLFGRATLGWTGRTQLSYGDVPFTELPSFGSPFDLRGFYWNQYRDRSMAYGIVEYRQMFGSQEAYEKGRFYSKLGYVVWVGTGTVGWNPSDWNEWRYNYGVGLRIQIQPRKNLRLDVGKGQGQEGMLFYMNMTEAF